MKIGISVPFDYFSPFPQSRDALVLCEKIGSSSDFLSTMRDHDIVSIELRGCGNDVLEKDILKTCEKVGSEGFLTTVHYHLPSMSMMKDLTPFLRFLDFIFPVLNKFQDELIMVVHAYSDQPNAYRRSLRKTSECLRYLSDFIGKNKSFGKIAVELTRGSARSGPGTTYKGLLELKRAIASETVGFCWDFGHAFSNFSHGVIPLKAPIDFVEQVIHTHIHGVDQNDVTHHPLNSENLPLDKFILPLTSSNYTGTFNLEINPGRLSTTESALSQLLKSIRTLRNHGGNNDET